MGIAICHVRKYFFHTAGSKKGLEGMDARFPRTTKIRVARIQITHFYTRNSIPGRGAQLGTVPKTTKNMFQEVNPKTHSKKPSTVKDLIVNTSGDLPRIELFARNVGLFSDGWDYWGNEI